MCVGISQPVQYIGTLRQQVMFTAIAAALRATGVQQTAWPRRIGEPGLVQDGVTES